MQFLQFQSFFRQRYIFAACHLTSWLVAYLFITTIIMQNPYAGWIEAVYGGIFLSSGALFTYFLRCVYKRFMLQKSNLQQLLSLLIGALVSTFLATTVLLTAVFFLAYIGVSRPIPSSQVGVIIELVGLSNGINMLGMTLLWSLGYLAVSKIKLLSEAHNLLTESQLQALNSQLNPHFLFNAINDIRALILAEPSLARTSLAELADMLRYSLQTNHKDKVPISEELANAEYYLNLCKIGLAERLKTEIDIAPESLNLTMPKMILQLCLENAIKHGIANSRQGGIVSLKITCKDNLVIEVINPLLKSKKPSDGLGLATKNIEKRLALLYKGQAKLSRVEQDQQVITRIELPKETV